MPKIKNLEYNWNSSEEDHSFPYLSKSINKIFKNLKNKKKLLDIGCGNGSLTKVMATNFNKTFAIDSSVSAIFFAKKKKNNNIIIKKVSLKIYKKYFKNKNFDTITAIEVIEHVYSPETFINEIKYIMNKKTNLIISTPYHGYFKNLLISILGKFDSHLNPLWEHGHIKFWSIKTFAPIK
mgnify:FL=1